MTSPKVAGNGRSEESGKKGDALTPRQLRAVAALVEGLDQAQAARSAGISTRTLRRWQEEPAFKAALTRASADAFEIVCRRMGKLAARAVNVLSRSLIAAERNGADANKSTAIATAVLDRAIKLRENLEVEARLVAIERRLEGSGR
jgi:hypothetical protein